MYPFKRCRMFICIFFLFLFFWIYAAHHQSMGSTSELMRYAKDRVDFITKLNARNLFHLVAGSSSTAYGGLILHEFSWVSLAVFFLYSSAGTRTHFAIRQSTVRELAITYGFISDAEDACGCDVLATMRFRKTQPQRKILDGQCGVEKEKSLLCERPSVRNFSLCLVFFLLLPAFILYYFMCWLHRTVCYSNGIKLRDSGDLCNRIHTVFGEERTRESCDGTPWTIVIAYVDSQVVGKWRNNGGVLRRPSHLRRIHLLRAPHTHIQLAFCMTAAVFPVLLNIHGNGTLHLTQLRMLIWFAHTS